MSSSEGEYSDVEDLYATTANTREREQISTLRGTVSRQAATIQQLKRQVTALELKLALAENGAIKDANLPDSTKALMQQNIKMSMMPVCKFWSMALSLANQEVIDKVLRGCGVTVPAEIKRLRNSASKEFSKAVNYYRSYMAKCSRNCYEGMYTVLPGVI